MTEVAAAASTTWLFAPGDRPDRIRAALASPASEVIVDLEDAVPALAKGAARHWLTAPGNTERCAWVRINSYESDWFEADVLAVKAAPRGRVRGVILPKAESRSAIEHLHSWCDGLEVLPLVETARGMRNLPELCVATGVRRLAFGSLDYATDLGVDVDGETVDWARHWLVVHSRAAGLAAPVDGVTAALDDSELLERAARRARSVGFGGKLVIHPAQLRAVDAGFVPTPDELKWAREIIDAVDGTDDGAAVIVVRGRMVDAPVVRRARSMLAVRSVAQ